MTKKTKIIISVFVAAIIIGVGVGFLFAKLSKTEPVTPKKEKPVAEKKVKIGPTGDVSDAYVSPTTGMQLENEPNQYFSVMIENSPDARPQSGLSSADIVYEIATEGLITRYLAFFHDSIPAKIGPVRSSRDYFIPIAEERNAPYIHFGGSTYAYKYLNSGNVKVPTIDGMKTESLYFMRDSSRVAPHNAYLLSGKLKAFDNKPLGEPFHFGTVNTDDLNDATNIEITYNNFTDVSYQYDTATQSYLRYLEGDEDIDKESNQQISRKNVILQYAKHTNLNDNKNRINVELTGSGKAFYFTNGKKIEGTWRKNNGEVTQFLDNTGNIVTLSPGKTWIEVVRTGIPIKIN